MARHPGRRIQVRRTRRSGVGKFKLHKPQWIDPFPQIPGTDPEKRIFSALYNAHIYFIFHGGSPPNARLVDPFEDDHDIDFYLPEYKVIIDPFSPFAHSQADSVVRDARKAAIFAAAGVVTYHPWAVAPGIFVLDQANQIVADWNGSHYLGHQHGAPPVRHQRIVGADALLRQLPLVMAGPRFPLTDQDDITAKRTVGYRIGSHLGAGADAVAAANHKRKRPPKMTLKLGR